MLISPSLSVTGAAQCADARLAGALHGEIRAKATVLSEFYTEDGCLMTIQASPALLGRLMAGGARVQSSGKPQNGG